jgi:hypothetical protein
LSISGGNTIALPVQNLTTSTGGTQSISFISQNCCPSITNIVSEPNGSAIYIISVGQYANSEIWVLKKDSISGTYYGDSYPLSITNICGTTHGTSIGNYIYLAIQPNNLYCGQTTMRFIRINKTTLTTESLTLIGSAPQSNGAVMFNDGTYIYMYDNNNVFKKYAISGSNIVDNGAVVMGSLGSNTLGMCSTTGGILLYDGSAIVRYSNTGVLQNGTSISILSNSIPPSYYQMFAI